jgi:MtaA/CmuA family methyltransferase
MNIAIGLVAKAAGATYREYVLDYRKLVEGSLICAERFGFDTVGVISDPMREASAFGAILTYPEHGVPFSNTPLLYDCFDLSLVKITDPLESPRTLDRIKGVDLLRRTVLNDYPVIGWIEGVLSEVANLRGVSTLMYDLVDNENIPLRELMDIVFTQQCRFAEEQISAGADIIGLGNVVASLIGPKLYKEYCLPYDKALVDFIHAHGAIAKLHISGNITKLLPLLQKVGADIVDIDWMVDYAYAAKVFEGINTSISGNIDPVAVLLKGSLALVEQKVLECATLEDNTVLVAGGCEVPAATPEQNLKLMDKLLYI